MLGCSDGKREVAANPRDGSAGVAQFETVGLRERESGRAGIRPCIATCAEVRPAESYEWVTTRTRLMRRA